MESIRENPNKYTIGKYLRKKKGLHQKDPKAIHLTPPEPLVKYLNYLFENGAVMNKLALAQFSLRNNLPYTGLIATQKILTDEIVLRIPKNLLLNTKKAFFSELRPIFLNHPTFFSSYHTSSWEDHMLLLYLLKEYSKGEESEFYHLIANLPRDIDYLIFWPDNELDQLEDSSTFRLAKNHRKEYDEEEKYVLELVEKYPELLDPHVFNKENIRWIYTHLVTRCFGKYFEYTTMIPIAELFNHECTDVYYDMEYYAENPNMPKDYSMGDAKEVEDTEIENNLSSEGSVGSEDEEFDSDFEYEKDGVGMEIEAEQPIEKKLKGLAILDEIRMRGDDIENYLSLEFDWADGFSIFFVKEVYQEVNRILAKYKKKEIDQSGARNLLANLETAMIIFKNEVIKFYKKVYRLSDEEIIPTQKKKFMEQAKTKEEKETQDYLNNQPAEKLFEPSEEWKDDLFDNFVMKASYKDQFAEGSQMYFCYGRLSNRSALLRYGIALEYNKYEHIHLKVPYIQYVKDVDWLVEKIKYFKLSRYMRFKLKRTKINISLINFCKGLNFKLGYLDYEKILKPNDVDLEIFGVEKAYELLQDKLKEFTKTPIENKQVLMDPKVGYHEYFAAVYRLERQRILVFHSRALLIVVEILKRIKKGLSLEFAVMRVHDLETEEECNRNRIFIADYLGLLRYSFPDLSFI